MPGDLLLRTGTGKRLPTGQTLVQHARQRIHIGTSINHPGDKPLRSHIGQRAHRRTGLRQLGPRHVMGNTEINQIHKIAPSHQRIGRFDITMHQPSTMSGVQRRRQPIDHPHRPRRRNRRVPLQQTTQVLPIDHRHHQIQPPIDLPGAMNRNDVRLGQPSHPVRLPAKPLPIPLHQRQLDRQYLDRHITANHRVMSPINLAHTALTDQLNQPVAPKGHLIHYRLPDLRHGMLPTPTPPHPVSQQRIHQPQTTHPPGHSPWLSAGAQGARDHRHRAVGSISRPIQANTSAEVQKLVAFSA